MGRYFQQRKRHALYYSGRAARRKGYLGSTDKFVRRMYFLLVIRCSLRHWMAMGYVSIECIALGAKGVQATSSCIPEHSCLLGCC